MKALLSNRPFPLLSVPQIIQQYYQVWYSRAALVFHELSPRALGMITGKEKGRGRHPCQYSSSEGVVNAPDSFKLIWQEDLEIAQTDLPLYNLRKHRSTPEPSLSNTVYLNTTTCVKQHSFKLIILLKWSIPSLGKKKYSRLIAAAKWSQKCFQKVCYLQHNLCYFSTN